jgi:hypothetical protein
MVQSSSWEANSLSASQEIAAFRRIKIQDDSKLLSMTYNFKIGNKKLVGQNCLSYSLIFYKQFYFFIFGLKAIGHGKPDSNFESLCIYYCALGNFSLDSILRYMNPVQIPYPTHPLNISPLFIIVSYRPGSCYWSLSVRFRFKNFYVFIFCLIPPTSSLNLVLLQFIILILFGEEYELWSSSLCRFLQTSAACYFLGPNHLHSTLF